MKIVPLELREANEFISNLHRHHKPVQGHRFSIGAEKDGKLVGVACIGRPVARLTNQKEVLEVTRLCTDGTKNACSALYAAAARIGKEMGYKKIQTFILEEEPGTTLKAAGWIYDGWSAGGKWYHKEGKPRRTDQPLGPKHRYAKKLNE